MPAQCHGALIRFERGIGIGGGKGPVKDQIIVDFGSGPEPIDAADAPAKLLSHLKQFKDVDEAASWWDLQKAGREQFFEKYPKLALQLKKDVEAFFATERTEAAA